MLTHGRQVVDEGVDAVLPNDDASHALAAKNLPEEGVSRQIFRSPVANRMR
jgi:hypothetical protein